MNKEELVELLAKSQDAILERVDSKLQELKRSISEDQGEYLSSVVKRVKEDNSIKWRQKPIRGCSTPYGFLVEKSGKRETVQV